MNKITKISISSIILLSSLGTLENPNNKALANETTNTTESIVNKINNNTVLTNETTTTPESIVNKINNNTPNLQSNLLADGPQKVVQNPGSMNWTYRNTTTGSTKLDSEGTYWMKKLIIEGAMVATGTKIANAYVNFIGSQITGEIAGATVLQRDKVYYYTNTFYTAKDSVNVYVKCVTKVYSDKAKTKLAYTTYAYHTY